MLNFLCLIVIVLVLRSCAQHEFACYSGQTCIPAFAQCDGTSDCLDGRDELNCDNNIQVTPGEYN